MILWHTEITKLFVVSYKKLSSRLQKQTDEAILAIAKSEFPADLGVPKKGKYGGYFAYELGRSYRLIYKVVNPQKIILLVVVGDHKSVYGND